MLAHLLQMHLLELEQMRVLQQEIAQEQVLVQAITLLMPVVQVSFKIQLDPELHL